MRAATRDQQPTLLADVRTERPFGQGRQEPVHHCSHHAVRGEGTERRADYAAQSRFVPWRFFYWNFRGRQCSGGWQIITASGSIETTEG